MTGSESVKLVHGFHYAFVGSAVFMLAALASLLLLLRQHHVARIEAGAVAANA